MSRVYTRDILHIDDRLEYDLAITQAEHNRMRSLGMHVVSYVVTRTTSHYAQMHSEFVSGVRIDQLPQERRDHEIGRVAANFLRYYQDTKDRRFPYIASDITQPFQFMYGTTAADITPRTYLVDIEPIVIDMAEATADPEGVEGLRLATELFQLQGWAQPHWERQGLPDFPYDIPTEHELGRLETLHLPWRC